LADENLKHMARQMQVSVLSELQSN
jgi:hypothetical protein